MRELIEKLERESGSHKGQNGKVGVVAGSRDYSGAPALSAKAALRTGCDLVKILTSRSVSSTVASYSENFIIDDYSADCFDTAAVEKALEIAEWADAVVIGPGLGDPEAEAVRRFMQEADCSMVVDADALEYAGRTPLDDAVLTPHSGEFEAHVEDILDELLENDNVVLKKGRIDAVYSRESEKDIETGHPAMTVGGTGDVLTGIVASLISQGLRKEEAAELGAWLNGKAGEKAAEDYCNSALATDIIEKIPEVLKDSGLD
ncbi:MAG: NAD(P)H-hydrate dehydratase [Candidatus Nanosalina sp.]